MSSYGFSAGTVLTCGLRSRRGTGRSLFRHRDEAARPRPRDRGRRAQPARRHVRLGRGAVRRDARQPRRQRSRQRGRDPRRVRLLGRHRRLPPRHGHRLVGPRLLRHRPQAPARDPSGPRAANSASTLQFDTEVESRRRYREYDLVVAADGANSKTRARPGARVQAGYRRARLQVHLARHHGRNSTTPSPSSSRRPSTAGSGRTPTSSTPTPRPSSSSARRRRGPVRLRRA